MSQLCLLCHTLNHPICPSNLQEKPKNETIRIKVSFMYAHYALLEKRAEKSGMHANRLIRNCALENSTLVDAKIKGAWLTAAYASHKQIRLSFYPNQFRKLEREAERLQVSIQELIRMSTSLA